MPQNIDITQLTLDQLLSLNHDVVALIKSRRRQEARDIKSELSVGDIVKFTERNGQVTKGMVKKIMRTRALVDVGVATYKVPMSMLSHV